MPCFNVEKTLGRALDSIIRQKTDFDYEVLIINDGSTDETKIVIDKYTAKYSQIKSLDNENNLGNAKSFKRGLEAAVGDYFAVLDGDDFYTVRDKLQRQVNFLDGDKRGEYGVVAHKYLAVYSDGAIREDWNLFNTYRDYSFCDFIIQKFYFHTSTIMYRNYFRGLEIPVLEIQRGDTIRTLISMNASYGKIKILDFVGAAYFLNPEGIWSSLDSEDRKKVNISTWRSCQSYTASEREKEILEFSLEQMAKKTNQPEENLWTPDLALKIVRHGLADPHAFHDRDFIFRKLYKSEVADSLCESIGYIQYNLLGLSPESSVDPKKIAIVISALNRTGGGIYREILEILEAMRTREVHLILTDMSKTNISDEVRRELSGAGNVKLIYLGDQEDKLALLETYLHRMKAAKIYYYCGHNNTLADAAIQDYGAKNIIPFSFDHGLSLGLDNTNVDLVIAKTPKDYKLLDKKFSDNVIYIPCWSHTASTGLRYSPVPGMPLNTATAAARFYKYENNILGKFDALVTHILQMTNGIHIHYGPIPEDIKEKINISLENSQIDKSRFIHIEWADNISLSMLENKVDIFISPFPISSIKLNLQCEAAGIPMMIYDGGLTRIEKNDFLHPDVLCWKNRKEFFNILKNITKEKLIYLSEIGKKYFAKHNDLAILIPYILFDKCFEAVPIPPNHVDRDIIDIKNIHDLLQWNLKDAQEALLDRERKQVERERNIR